MTDNKTAEALTRDDLWVSYGPTESLILCPACDASPGFDADGEMIGEDRRWVTMSGPDHRRLCDPCIKRIVGQEILDLLEVINEFDSGLFGVHRALEDGDRDKLVYASEVTAAGVRLVASGLSQMFGVPDPLNKDLIQGEHA